MQQKRGMQVDMLNGSIVKPLLIFMIPIAISYLFQQLYNTVDTMIVGRYLGESSLAAIGSASTIYNLLTGFCFGFGNGLSIISSRAFGQDDEDLLKRSVVTGTVISLVIALSISLLAHFGSGALLRLIHTPENIMEEAETYIVWITSFIVVSVLYNLLSGLLRAIGNSVMPLVFLVLASVGNVFLDLLFIGKLGFGIKGAAIATVIAQGISVILCLIYIFRNVPLVVPQRKHFVFSKGLVVEMLNQGLSLGLMSSIVNAGTVILQSGINNMGEMIIAGHISARKIYLIFMTLFYCLSQATMTFVSQNYGAGNKQRIKDVMKAVVLISAVVCFVQSVIIFAFASDFVRFVSGSNNEILIANGTAYLKILTPFTVVLGVLFNTRMALQGLGQKIMPLVSSIIELIGKIIFTMLLVPVYQYKAVMWCEPIIWCFMTLQLVISFYREPYIREK